VRKTNFTAQKTRVYILCSLLRTVLPILWIRSANSNLFAHVILELHELIQLFHH